MDETGRLSERNQRIWDDYILRGKTMEALAAEHGISFQRISQVIKEIRESLPERDREEVIDRRVAQIGAVVQGLLPQALTGDKDAVASLEKMMGREAKYLGLDAPTRTEVSGKIATYELPGVDMDAL